MSLRKHVHLCTYHGFIVHSYIVILEQNVNISKDPHRTLKKYIDTSRLDYIIFMFLDVH